MFGGPRFVKLVLRASHVRKLDDKMSLTARFAGQYASEALPSAEQFYFGGSEFGRGFDSAAAYAESGAAGALELSRQILPMFGAQAPQVSGFFDAGALDPQRDRGMRHTDLSSAGVGVTLPLPRSRIAFQLARPLSGADKKETRFLVNAQTSF